MVTNNDSGNDFFSDSDMDSRIKQVIPEGAELVRQLHGLTTKDSIPLEVSDTITTIQWWRFEDQIFLIEKVAEDYYMVHTPVCGEVRFDAENKYREEFKDMHRVQTNESGSSDMVISLAKNNRMGENEGGEV